MIISIQVSEAKFRRVCKEIGLQNNSLIEETPKIKIVNKNDYLHIGKHGSR